ncbi:MAG: Maf family protein [Gammaproteobacteria bacterium]
MDNFSLLKPLIIATSSSIRKEIITNAGLDCVYVSSDLDEEKIKKKNSNLSFIDLAIKLASAKALEISKKNKDIYVLGVDQICQFDDEILNKPLNKVNCTKALLKLSGNTHFQNCGMSIAYNNKIIWSESSIARLEMKYLSAKQISDYIDLDEPFNSCGSYKYEKNGKDLFKNVSGSIYTIQGLDIEKVLIFLRQNQFI